MANRRFAIAESETRRRVEIPGEEGPVTEGESVKVMPTPADEIKHKIYKKVDIRSHPLTVTRKQWKIRLDITFQTGVSTKVMHLYLAEEQFPTLQEAHTATFEWGRRIIDEWLLTRKIPSGPKAAGGLLRAQRTEMLPKGK